MEDHFNPAAFLEMNEAVIDACSLIYLIKTGVLWNLGAVFTLHATSDVVRETDWKDLPVDERDFSAGAVSHDEALVRLAEQNHWPVISDDREVLLMAGASGLSYYNALMMLIWLEARERITADDSDEYFNRLKETARYSEAVWQRGMDYRDTLKHYRTG